MYYSTNNFLYILFKKKSCTYLVKAKLSTFNFLASENDS
jgi:hypothetical protein